MIEKAYQLADNAHKDQKRKSGEPYIIHPLCVAIILGGSSRWIKRRSQPDFSDVVEGYRVYRGTAR